MRGFLLTVLTIFLSQQFAVAQEQLQYRHNKEIPKVIERSVLTALSHFPELKETAIQFVFTNKLETSIMAARPTIGSLFKKRKNRSYKVLINPAFKLDYGIESINQIPDSVMIGWLGHELGHIMDYEQKNGWGIMGMGISYWLSKNYIRQAERVADSFAVDHGMGSYLVAKKSFILDHTELPQAYRDKIEALYLSPDDIYKLVADLEEEDTHHKEEMQVYDEQGAYELEKEMHEESLPGNT